MKYNFCLCLKGWGILDKVVFIGPKLGEMSLTHNNRGDVFHM